MLHIDVSAYLNCKEDVSLENLKSDFLAFCSKYGKYTRASVDCCFSDEGEFARLSAPVLPSLTDEQFDSLKASLENGGTTEPVVLPEAPKPKKPKAKKTEEAPVEEAPAEETPAPVEEAPKDEIDLPQFPPMTEVSKETLRDLLRTVKEASNETLGLRSVYVNAGKEGKTFATLSADEYAVMYEEGRKVLWQLMHS